MQNFIVLGYVPGTHIQITFGGWLMVSAAVILLAMLFYIRHSFKAWVLSWYVDYLIRHRQLA